MAHEVNTAVWLREIAHRAGSAVTLGDAFVARPAGDNGATLDYVHQGKSDVNVYVDDDSSGCTNGVNTQGPNGPATCAGGQYDYKLP